MLPSAANPLIFQVPRCMLNAMRHTARAAQTWIHELAAPSGEPSQLHRWMSKGLAAASCVCHAKENMDNTGCEAWEHTLGGQGSGMGMLHWTGRPFQPAAAAPAAPASGRLPHSPVAAVPGLSARQRFRQHLPPAGPPSPEKPSWCLQTMRAGLSVVAGLALDASPLKNDALSKHDRAAAPEPDKWE